MLLEQQFVIDSQHVLNFQTVHHIRHNILEGIEWTF